MQQRNPPCMQPSGEQYLTCRVPPDRIMNQLLPPGDALPGSLYLVRKLVGAKDLSSYTWHACRNECHSWEPLLAEQWATCQDKCPKCDEPRFQRSRKNGKTSIQPFKVSRRRGSTDGLLGKQSC